MVSAAANNVDRALVLKVMLAILAIDIHGLRGPVTPIQRVISNCATNKAGLSHRSADAENSTVEAIASVV